jgi:hypothetical protein
MSDARQPVPSPILGIVGLVVAAGLIILVMNARSGPKSPVTQTTPTVKDVSKPSTPPDDPEPVKEPPVTLPSGTAQTPPDATESPKPALPSPDALAAMDAVTLKAALEAIPAADRARFASDALLAMASGSKGKVEAVVALRDAGADINAADERGRTPLMLAAAAANVDAVFALLDSGAAVWTKDAEGMDAREHALARNDERGYEIADVLESARPE